MKELSVAEIIEQSWRKGVTFGRGRALFHRWDYRKIRGSIPISEHWAMQVAKDNLLFRALTKMRTDQLSEGRK